MPSTRMPKPSKKDDAKVIKSLKADAKRRSAAMDTAAKAGVKLTGSRFEGGPNFSSKEAGAVKRYAGTKQAKKDAEKAKADQMKRNMSAATARGKALREGRASNETSPRFTG